jgi:hypothetical protein
MSREFRIRNKDASSPTLTSAGINAACDATIATAAIVAKNIAPINGLNNQAQSRPQNQTLAVGKNDKSQAPSHVITARL